MKCDELKPIVFSLNELSYIDESAVQKNFENPHDHAVYKATEVDAAIDELKSAHHKERHEYIKMIAELKKKLMPCLNGDCILTCEVVEKYGKENAELKQKLEDAQASAYADSVDAGMRERRLKRALYNACANWAHVAVAFFSSYAIKEKWRKMENKCRAKTEAYK